MRKSKKSLLVVASVLLIPFLSACGSSQEIEGAINLRVYNCEDYICEDPVYADFDEDGETEEYSSIIDAFENYERIVNGKNVHVIYECFDTNETMLSSLKTGKCTYDLVCPSDYAIQKMMRLGMLEPYDDDALPNYNETVSKYLHKQMKTITAPVDGVETPIDKYAKGYMWGTLGIQYNPEKIAKEKGLEEEEVHADMADWTKLWDWKYKNEMSIKDSMRDTYAMGIMEVFDADIKKNLNESGFFDESYNLLDMAFYDSALEDYSPLMGDIFNRCDKETTKKVEESLLRLKSVVYGFEVDSGKDDIVKGHVGINLAWSGDAVYSIETAGIQNGVSLYYSMPKTGGNIWFDGWVMPKSSSLHKEEAQEFVDFLSRPDMSAANMESVGYTSFMAGDSTLDLMRLWYDPRSYEMYQYEYDEEGYGYFVTDENGELVYIEGMEGSTYEEAVVTDEESVTTIMSWEDYAEDNELEWDIVNLTYMFEGTIVDHPLPSPLGDTPETNPYFFYTDERVHYTDALGNDAYAGGQFFAQYPPMEIIPKLAVMKDYGDNNQNVLLMWENVKGNNLPLWGVLVFFGILLGLGAIALTMFITKARFRKIKVARRRANSADVEKRLKK